MVGETTVYPHHNFGWCDSPRVELHACIIDGSPPLNTDQDPKGALSFTTRQPSPIEVLFLARDFFRSTYLVHSTHSLLDLIKMSPHIKQEKEFDSVIGDDFFRRPFKLRCQSHYCFTVFKNIGKSASNNWYVPNVPVVYSLKGTFF